MKRESHVRVSNGEDDRNVLVRNSYGRKMDIRAGVSCCAVVQEIVFSLRSLVYVLRTRRSERNECQEMLEAAPARTKVNASFVPGLRKEDNERDQ